MKTKKEKEKQYINNYPKGLYLGIFGMVYVKAIVKFEISNFEFVKLQSFVQREKNPKFGTRNVLFKFF